MDSRYLTIPSAQKVRRARHLKKYAARKAAGKGRHAARVLLAASRKAEHEAAALETVAVDVPIPNDARLS